MRCKCTMRSGAGYAPFPWHREPCRCMCPLPNFPTATTSCFYRVRTARSSSFRFHPNTFHHDQVCITGHHPLSRARHGCRDQWPKPEPVPGQSSWRPISTALAAVVPLCTAQREHREWQYFQPCYPERARGSDAGERCLFADLAMQLPHRWVKRLQPDMGHGARRQPHGSDLSHQPGEFVHHPIDVGTDARTQRTGGRYSRWG